MPAYCDCFFSEISALWWVLLVSPSPTRILISVLGVIDAPVPSPSWGRCWMPLFPLLPCEYTISLRSLLPSPVWIRSFPCVSHLLRTWSDYSKHFKSFCSLAGHWPYSQGQLSSGYLDRPGQLWGYSYTAQDVRGWPSLHLLFCIMYISEHLLSPTPGGFLWIF